MNRHLRSLLAALPLAALVSMVAGLWLRRGHESKAAPTAVAGLAPNAPPAFVRSAAALPLPAEKPASLIARLRAAGTRPVDLLAADAFVRKLIAADFPAVCDEALNIPEKERKAVLRLLCIRWAELDGAAAVHWAKAHLWKKDSEEWRVWLGDLVSTWFAAQPQAAAEWIAEITHGDESSEWAPLGGYIAVDDWQPPGHIVEMARAAILSQVEGVHISMTDRSLHLASLIRSRAEIEQILDLLKDHPPMRATRKVIEGLLAISSGGENESSSYAAAVEKAWPRVDPEGFRQYATEHPTGVMGDHLLLAVAVEDCRASATPAAVAAHFLAENPPTALSWTELLTLTDAVAEKDARGSREILRGHSNDSVATTIEQLVLRRNRNDWRGVVAALDDLMAPDSRDRAVEACLVRWHTRAREEAEAFLATSGWSTERLTGIAEMLASAPLTRP